MPEIRHHTTAHGTVDARPNALTTAMPRTAQDAPIVTRETYRSSAQFKTRIETVWPRHRLARLDGLLAVALFVAALAARAPFISNGETLLHSDEAIVGLMAQDIAAGNYFPIYFYGQRYMGALEAYTIAAISPFFENPIHALRAGPALFFASLVVAQFLMLTRWFGRRGGLIGAAVLICASPMFMQWSISARGAYIEILLWGSLLLWSYTEWFMGATPNADGRAAKRRRLLFGLLIGSGLWLNPSIVLFIVPIVLHALMANPLSAAYNHAAIGRLLHKASDFFGRTTLPIAVIAAVLLLNLTWAVWVSDHKIHSELMLGVVPKPIALAIYTGIGAGLLWFLNNYTNLVPTIRHLATRNAAMILGVVLGSAPAILYTVQAAIGGRTLDPSLPLGFRPVWLTGDTLVYLIKGLPMLFGADPRPFLQLVGTGRDTVVAPLSIMNSALVIAGNCLMAGGLLSAAAILGSEERRNLVKLFRLQPDRHTPTILLMIAVASTLALYLLGGCTLDFTTIRYLVPLWVFLPGLLAAVFVNQRFRIAGGVIPLTLCAAWGVGQLAMNTQLGAPHPLRRVADRLVANGVDPAVAEPLDAHLLSYLTQQKCRTVEFESFWPRLGQYHDLIKRNKPTDYLVQTAELDRTWDWIRGGWPGEAPPETRRFLWPKLRRWIRRHPETVVERQPLPDGYERIRLSQPMPDRTLFGRRSTHTTLSSKDRLE